jgi:hypothetical protein
VWNAQGSQQQEIWFTTSSSTWGWTDMVHGGVSAGASIDAGIDGPYFLYQSGANPPDDMIL